jgi:hypothetical protein
MNTVLATFNELEPARRLGERLLQAGIHAVIRDESRRERTWFMSRPLAAFHVEVRQSAYLQARGLIEEWDQADGALKEAVRCPECNSSHVEFPQFPRKFFLPRLGALLLVLGIVPRKFYCFDCHSTWPTEIRLEPKPDILGWPSDSKLWHDKPKAVEVPQPRPAKD